MSSCPRWPTSSKRWSRLGSQTTRSTSTEASSLIFRFDHRIVPTASEILCDVGEGSCTPSSACSVLASSYYKLCFLCSLCAWSYDSQANSRGSCLPIGHYMWSRRLPQQPAEFSERLFVLFHILFETKEGHDSVQQARYSSAALRGAIETAKPAY
jgi:hypothetical protein